MILIKNGRLMDPLSGRDKIQDILIKGEKIVKIEESIEAKEEYKLIDASGLIVAPGLIDVHVHFRDPGGTHKEDLVTGSTSAARGGYTTVVCMANTKPVVDNVDTLKTILEKTKDLPIEVLQVSTVTKGIDGKDLADLKSLRDQGAVGFSDDGKPIMDVSVLKKAMEISKELDMPISLHEEDPSLIEKNGINKFSPRLAEDVMVSRDVALAISIGSKLNIQHISSGVSVEAVRLGKKMGANIFAEVTPHHFTLTEEALEKHGSLAKMNPPLRSSWDKEKVIEGLKDGTIDIIATDHAPHTKEEKDGDIALAPSGIVGLETALSLAITKLVDKGHLSMIDMLKKLTVNPAKLYKLDRGYIKENHRADLVIFSPDEKHKIEEFSSKSWNSPFLNERMKGKIKITISNGNIVYQDL
ncbi:MAG: dihydroorotase [Tissierella sp.]|uniref:dihydroorotase n=1 Tax=Tissierella sp. TaxID=41274 RepID=UPI003F9CAB83